jgi:glycogen phosphorylase
MSRAPIKELARSKKLVSSKTEARALAFYECGPLRFNNDADNYDRHVVFDHVVCLERASDRERFEAVARALRDLLTQRWLLTEGQQ